MKDGFHSSWRIGYWLLLDLGVYRREKPLSAGEIGEGI